MDAELELIKELRELTGAGIVDVKAMLTRAGGDREKAIELLRLEGVKVAEKKASRTTREGVIGSYVHANKKVASMVALACETDFVARNEIFTATAHDIAMHIAALDPTYLDTADVPEKILEKERSIYRQQLAVEGKPEAIREKIVERKLAKYYEQHCLLCQKFIKEDTKTVRDLLVEATAKLGEKIEIRSFTRFQL